jgi:hypothetical protein
MSKDSLSHNQTHSNSTNLIVFSVWVIIVVFFLSKFGLTFFISFPYTLLFSSIVILWISVAVLYYGKFIAKWGLRYFLGYLLMAIIAIPIATHLHVSYLHRSAEIAFRDFIATINDGNLEEKYIVDNWEGVNCISEDMTSSYSLKDDYFMGVYDWWIEFENGTEYQITTSRVGLSLWHVSVRCPFGRDS